MIIASCLRSGTKKEPKPKLLSPDIFWWGGVFHVKGWVPKSSACPSKRGIPGFCREIPEAPEKFEKKKRLGSIFGPYTIRKRKTHEHKQICGIVLLNWVGAKNLFMCFYRVIPFGGEKHINKSPPKIPGPSRENFDKFLSLCLRACGPATEPKNPWIPEIRKNYEIKMQNRPPRVWPRKLKKLRKWPKIGRSRIFWGF